MFYECLCKYKCPNYNSLIYLCCRNKLITIFNALKIVLKTCTILIRTLSFLPLYLKIVYIRMII